MLLAVLAAARAAASTALYVDGGCPVAGDGSAATPCAAAPGAPGPLTRVSAGVARLAPGGTLLVRGRHDGFDGVYRGDVLAIYGDRALDCRAAPCIIRGFAGERPVLSGFTIATGWRRTSAGSRVWFRAMERHDECQGLGPSGGAAARHRPDADWDPQIVVQQRGGERTPLHYNDRVGEAALVERRLVDDGSWWHDLAARTSYVNPWGDGDPNRDPETTLLVPQEQVLIVLDGSGTCGARPARVSHNVRFEQIDLEGARSKFVEVNGRPDEYAGDIRFRDVSMRFGGGRFAFHVQRVARLELDRVTTEWLGRGMSWADHTHAIRAFHMDRAALSRITCRHLGSDNRGRRAFLDPPWAADLPSWWTGGTCLQVKQSNDVTVRDLTAEDLSLVAVAIDVSRRTVVDGFDIRRAASGIDLQEFTPSPPDGCDERNAEHFCHNHDHVVRNGLIHATGIPEAGAIAVSAGRRDARDKLQPGQRTLTVHNVAISHPGGAAVRVRDVDAVAVSHVSAYGAMASLFPDARMRPPRGIVLEGTVHGFQARNNVFARLGDVAIDVVPPALDGEGDVAFDHDLFDVGTAPLARWHGQIFSGLDGPRGLRATGQEPHGREGAPRFASVPGTALRPPRLDLLPGSAAAGIGEALSAELARDLRGRPRHTWDAGAHVAPTGGRGD